jgi:hypothetical protein
MQSDGSLLNISRTFPYGGSHVYIQDRTTLARKQVGEGCETFDMSVISAALLRQATVVLRPVELDRARLFRSKATG